jgi:hypothetical protein
MYIWWVCAIIIRCVLRKEVVVVDAAVTRWKFRSHHHSLLWDSSAITSSILLLESVRARWFIYANYPRSEYKRPDNFLGEICSVARRRFLIYATRLINLFLARIANEFPFKEIFAHRREYKKTPFSAQSNNLFSAVQIYTKCHRVLGVFCYVYKTNNLYVEFIIIRRKNFQHEFWLQAIWCACSPENGMFINEDPPPLSKGPSPPHSETG